MFGVFEDALARTFHLLVATLRPFAQELFDIRTQSPHVLSECAALQRSVPNTMPPVKHLVAMFEQRRTDLAGPSRIFAKGREITPQMSPTPLSKARVKVVSTVAVRYQNTAKRA